MNAPVASHLLNDRALPFFEEQGVPLLRALADRGPEYCGSIERHEYQLYLATPARDRAEGVNGEARIYVCFILTARRRFVKRVC
jgi:hypothetical protein